MGRNANVTQEKVNAVADALVAKGEKPTSRAVRLELGEGSMATILRLLQNWQSAQATNFSSVSDSLESDVVRAINGVMSKKLKDALENHAATIQELQADLSLLLQENDRQATELEDNIGTISGLQTQLLSSASEVGSIKLQLSRTQEAFDSEIRTREAAQSELAKARVRIECIPQLIRETKEAQLEAKVACETAAELRGRIKELREVGETSL